MSKTVGPVSEEDRSAFINKWVEASKVGVEKAIESCDPPLTVEQEALYREAYISGWTDLAAFIRDHARLILKKIESIS